MARPTGITEPDALKAINLLRAELVDSLIKAISIGLLSHLDPDVVVTWQNAEVCRGPQPSRRITTIDGRPESHRGKLSSNPVVDDRHVYGDWAVSWGNLHDDMS